ncbi:MAG TPA: phosphoglucosamine mutase [Terriglobales bacterium]|nr:phosphoglucosamine mutase [Terriglobales bacterium]
MTSERKLFGTDGIRGLAGAFPLDPDTTFAIGRALARHLARGARRRRVVVGQDTRESSPSIADLVAAGLTAEGVEVESAGVITTPGIAHLARCRKFDAGVVISASHNPWTDNGIKVFGPNGYKLPDEIELEVEHEIFAGIEKAPGEGPRPAQASACTLPGNPELQMDYVEHLIANVEPVRRGLKLVVDCAHGAASAVAPQVFTRWNKDLSVEFIHRDPDGQNINDHCGALHPETVAHAVAERQADLGITFDGDADRALFADASGKVVNGDAVLLLAAREMKSAGRLRNDLVVATTMSNMGLEAALKRSGIRMLRAPVGDKYVLEEMRKNGATLGGEQSGHIIFLEDATTGDGLLTALHVLHMVGRSGKSLAELVADLKVFPQVIKNVRVREKKPLMEIPEVARAIREAEHALDGNGRVVVRYSGTEALARVMIEAESEQTMHRYADSIVAAIQKALGV